jgi:nicotinate-nucleotide adenylyltransferase
VSLQLYLGGTFNPIHVGHARLALECHLLTGAAVNFIISPRPPLKNEPQISLNHRIEMVNRVIDELNASLAPQKKSLFGLELCEIQMEGPSYTVNTMEYLHRQSPATKIVWIMGMDNLNSLENWHNWRALTDYANLLIVNRPNFIRQCNSDVAEWLNPRISENWTDIPQAGRVIFAETTPLAISSTDIRFRLAAHESCKYLLPESVGEYIRHHQLYL